MHMYSREYASHISFKLKHSEDKTFTILFEILIFAFSIQSKTRFAEYEISSLDDISLYSVINKMFGSA